MLKYQTRSQDITKMRPNTQWRYMPTLSVTNADSLTLEAVKVAQRR